MKAIIIIILAVIMLANCGIDPSASLHFQVLENFFPLNNVSSSNKFSILFLPTFMCLLLPN